MIAHMLSFLAKYEVRLLLEQLVLDWTGLFHNAEKIARRAPRLFFVTTLEKLLSIFYSY